MFLLSADWKFTNLIFLSLCVLMVDSDIHINCDSLKREGCDYLSTKQINCQFLLFVLTNMVDVESCELCRVMCHI
jgi:hypothetical protein